MPQSSVVFLCTLLVDLRSGASGKGAGEVVTDKCYLQGKPLLGENKVKRCTLIIHLNAEKMPYSCLFFFSLWYSDIHQGPLDVQVAHPRVKPALKLMVCIQGSLQQNSDYLWLIWDFIWDLFRPTLSGSWSVRSIAQENSCTCRSPEISVAHAV